jgi:hypothetical protein
MNVTPQVTTTSNILTSWITKNTIEGGGGGQNSRGNSFLTSALDVREWSTSCPGHFTPRGGNPCSHWRLGGPHSGSGRFRWREKSGAVARIRTLDYPAKSYEQYLPEICSFCTMQRNTAVLSVDHSETSVYQTTRRHILYQGAPRRSVILHNITDRLRGDNDGLHNILNSLWTVLRYIHALTACLPSSKYVSITIIPVARERTLMNFRSSKLFPVA